jgi:hypothetical protein
MAGVMVGFREETSASRDSSKLRRASLTTFHSDA